MSLPWWLCSIKPRDPELKNPELALLQDTQVRSGQVRVTGASGHSILSADYCVTVSYGSLIINVTSMTFTFTTSDERKRHKINSQ